MDRATPGQDGSSERPRVGVVKAVREGDFLLARSLARDLFVPLTAVRNILPYRVELAVPAVYSVRASIPALLPPDCERIEPDGVHGRHRAAPGRRGERPWAR